jgi:hypothetical protein
VPELRTIRGLVAALSAAILGGGCMATPEITPLLPVDASFPDTGIDDGWDAGVLDAGPNPGEIVCRSYANDIQPIWAASCSFVGCHVPPAPPLGLDLSPEVSYGNLVGLASRQDPSRQRIQAGNPAASYLIAKIEGTAGNTQMPIGRPALPVPIRALLRDWVEQGAPRGEFNPCSPVGSSLVGSVQIGPPSDTRVAIGGLLTLTATATDGRGSALRGATIAWRSSDETVLYVDPTGAALGLSTGRVAVVASAGGVDSFPLFLEVTEAVVGPPSFTQEVMPVFTARCASSRCHVGTFPAGQLPLDLDPAAVRAALVDEDAAGLPVFSRVDPGYPERSYLTLKLTQSDPPGGYQMPLGRPRLSAAELSAIFRWVLHGARE